jgi:N6-adenosine-specific RNA methylase IME4
MASVEKTDEFLEEYEAKCNDRGVEMSSAGFLKFAREKQHEDLPKVELPEGKYNVIYADPPWPVGSIVMDKWESPINEKYPTMTIDEIRNLPINDLSAENCSLFLWTTHTYLPDALQLIKEWGFKYHCVITWNKHSGWTQFGFHKMTEFLIYAYKGKMNIDQYGKAIPTLIDENKTHHSKKPDSIRDLIKSKTPEGRIELFARDKYEGWEAWGNQL